MGIDKIQIIVSIIIPYYNTLTTLERLLESIEQQTCMKNLEVIIVDDNSSENTDEYRELIKKHSMKKNYIFLNNNSGKKGAGSCRNIGMAAAKGRWLVFADADDIFSMDYYKTISKWFSCKADIIYFKPLAEKNGISSNTRDSIIYYRKLCEAYLQKRDWAETLLRYRWNAPWSKMIRKDLALKNNVYFDQVMYSNDVLFSTKCGYYASKIVANRESFYIVTENNRCLTADLSKESFFIRESVAINNMRFLNEHVIEGEKYLSSLNSLRNIKTIINRKYGLQTIKEYIQLYKKNGIPIIPKKHLGIMYRIKKELASIEN